MISYNQFQTTNDHAFNLYHAIQYCKAHSEDCLVFPKGVYDFYGEKASEAVLKVSNHDIYGIQRIAFLVQEMKNFTIDGGGSTFVFHGSVIPFALLASEEITLRNFTVDMPSAMVLDILVTQVQPDYVDVRVVNDEDYYVCDRKLWFRDESGNNDFSKYAVVRSMDGSKAFIPESGDTPLFGDTVWFEDLKNRCIRIHRFNKAVRPGMHIIIRGVLRYACDIVVDHCRDVNLNQITLLRSYAMGLLVQKTENVSVDSMTVKARDDCLLSLNCDATHFINCKGIVKVTNSCFSEQEDDALNIHGIFTKIVDKTDDYILVKYMHTSAKGIDIYDPGSRIQVLNQKNLIPAGEYEIERVEVVNMEYTKLYIKGGTADIPVGYVVEDLTWVSDLLFENNRVVNNRARGILIGSKGKTVVRNNYFNTPGVAILFESDGQYWFESGGTTDVEITGNVFDHCKYTLTSWGSNVIEVKPREEFLGDQYYHNRIRITNNVFRNNPAPLLYADNIREVVFRDNKVENHGCGKTVQFVNCGQVDTDMDYK